MVPLVGCYYYSRDYSDNLSGHGGMVMAVTDEAVDWPGGRVRAYLQGLLAPEERKNGWQLAENAGDRTPDGVQEFLAGMRWDADQVRDDLRSYVVAQLGEADGVL